MNQELFSSIANSQLYIELIFVNTDPQTVEKRLGIKSAMKKKGIIAEANGEDGGTAEQMHKENNRKKKQPFTSGASPSTFFMYFTDIKGFF